MAWIAPKLDWNDTNSINYADWNRIENNIQELYTYLVSIQYDVPAPSSPNTSRNMYSIDYLISINRIEANLDNIRLAFLSPADYLPKETWTVGKGFDYTDANRLESNTNKLLQWGMNVYLNYKRCGDLICGDTGALY